MNQWTALGNVADLRRDLDARGSLMEIEVDGRRFVLSYFNGEFGALNAKCNHMGAPLAQGRMVEGRIQCPWHYWEFDHRSGAGVNRSYEPLASNGGVVPSFPLKIENETLFIDIAGENERVRPSYNPMHPVARDPVRAAGPVRVLGLSTTAMDPKFPRYSTSEHLLKSSLARAEKELGVETQFLALADLKFRHCEGFYSKSERACTWPCSITKLDPADEMVKVYEAMVHWADVVIMGTPIRWGSASSLYYKMAERLNSVQNQITLRDRVLIKDKVAGFIITGGQDNIQAVAGQMLMFFGELGFVSPPFPFVAHSRGWSSEDMEHNMTSVRDSEYLHQQSFELVERSVKMVGSFITH
ncbi:MAG: NAD(P)H-dependent oxidoreductase [Bdellovibrionaceae bacterium]|nr:NAD(P)H-dependent oxidoreductase [Pseudobdellovibrionaceae bacterium]